MHELVVIYASEDLDLVEKLAALLKKHWEDVWYAEEGISSGEWDKQVDSAIANTRIVVALTSSVSVNKPIFKDEMKLAKAYNKPLLPFVIEKVAMPLGFGGTNCTNAYGWVGEEDHLQFQKLLKKIAKELEGHSLKRKISIQINNKELSLPGFVFSLSSHETQIQPTDGLKLFSMLEQPSAALVSSYDAWTSHKDNKFNKWVRELDGSGCIFFMDSGNYESHRKKDIRSNKNKDGWWRKKHIDMVKKYSPDIVFSFDKINPKGLFEEVLFSTINNVRSDIEALDSLPTKVCPIIHIPDKIKDGISRDIYAANLIKEVAKSLDPIMVAVPERELGDGIHQRIKTVKAIRDELNQLGKYYPLHLLGTGNPMSILLFADAGADCFDGLEWCRTVADWEKRTLHHFQQLDFFLDSYIGRISDDLVRALLESEKTPYAMKVACYNMEVMNSFTEELQSMLFSGNIKYMMKSSIPHVGNDLSKGANSG